MRFDDSADGVFQGFGFANDFNHFLRCVGIGAIDVALIAGGFECVEVFGFDFDIRFDIEDGADEAERLDVELA